MNPEEPATRDGQSVSVVYEKLRQAILSGDIVPGQLTSQSELGADLEFSRTPLREALRMLQHEGLVVLQPNRRVRIGPLSAAEAEELYMMRVALEAMAVRLTVPALVPEDIAALEGIMAQLDHLFASGSPSFPAAHKAFHMRFCARTGARPLAMISQLSDHAERYRIFYGAADPGHWERRRGQHRAILDAAAAGDAAAAAAALVVHYVDTARLVAAASEPPGDLSRLRATVEVVAPGALSALG
jgi:DNA-binding GntR family transcriptional regulator